MEEAMGCATGAGDNWLFELSNCSFYFGLIFEFFIEFMIFLFWSGYCATGAGNNWVFELSNCSFYFGLIF